jgi:hypothetical protein
MEARAFRASSIFQLARLIEKGLGCSQNSILACDYFEFAFIYSDHYKERSLALYKVKKSYYQSLIDSGSKESLDSVDVSLQQLKHYLGQPWREFNPDINTRRIVLDLITCRSAKIQIDYLYNNVSDNIPNSNMINLLYLLEQYNFTHILRYHLKLKKTLQPIDDLFMSECLSPYDKEIFEKIREICQLNHSAPYLMHTP